MAWEYLPLDAWKKQDKKWTIEKGEKRLQTQPGRGERNYDSIAERVVITSECYANVDRRLCISSMEPSEKPESFENDNRRSASDHM